MSLYFRPLCSYCDSYFDSEESFFDQMMVSTAALKEDFYDIMSVSYIDAVSGVHRLEEV